MAKIIVIDNYDSFTYNLVQMFMCYNLDLEIYRHDEVSVKDMKKKLPDYILVSPGPKTPSHAGVSKDFIKSFCSNIPILGVCLGMQCINEFLGGKTVPSPTPIHGKTSNIYHQGNGLFKGIPSPFKAARYHSLIIEPKKTTLENNSLTIDAWSSDGVIMSLSHRNFPLHGLQFHPESFLTEYGSTIIKNFLNFGSLNNQI